MADNCMAMPQVIILGKIVDVPIKETGATSHWIMREEFDGMVSFYGPVEHVSTSPVVHNNQATYCQPITIQGSQIFSQPSLPPSLQLSLPYQGLSVSVPPSEAIHPHFIAQHGSTTSTSIVIASSKESSQSDHSELTDEMMSPSSNGSDPMNNPPIENVWHGEFFRLFQHFPHYWSLQPLLLDPSVFMNGANWHEYHDSAKVRFLCMDCNNGWTSMKGRVVFWYSLNQKILSPGLMCWEGKVLFRLFGQKCQKCNSPKFQQSLWYGPEVIKVVRNIHAVVSQNIYSFHGVQLIKGKMRSGRPSKEHNSESCEACANGICCPLDLRNSIQESETLENHDRSPIIDLSPDQSPPIIDSQSDQLKEDKKVQKIDNGSFQRENEETEEL